MDVLLVHGLGRTTGSLWRLGRALGRAGHDAQYFGYFAWAEPHERIIRRLGARLESLAGRAGAYAAVGHSLGGLLLRHALARYGHVDRPAVLVMLGTPNRPARAAQRAGRYAPFRWTAGDCGRVLADPGYFAALEAPDYSYHIIAGTRGWRGRRNPFGTEPNDGLVAVSETRIGPCDRIVEVPALHTFLMNDQRVRAAILQALDRAAEQDRHCAANLSSRSRS
jgi:hypothetical protein